MGLGLEPERRPIFSPESVLGPIPGIGSSPFRCFFCHPQVGQEAQAGFPTARECVASARKCLGPWLARAHCPSSTISGSSRIHFRHSVCTPLVVSTGAPPPFLNANGKGPAPNQAEPSGICLPSENLKTSSRASGTPSGAGFCSIWSCLHFLGIKGEPQGY